MSTQTAMKVNMPYDKVLPDDPVCESCVLTVLLDKNNIIKYYEGTIENTPVVRQTGYSPEQIRKVLMDKMHKVERVRGKKEVFILIIKSSAGSTFKNFIDMTDEATICNISRYYIDDMKEGDKGFMKK